MQAKNRIIVAVDVNDPRKAMAIVSLLAAYVGSFKIGLELITAFLVSILVQNEKAAQENAELVRAFFKLTVKQMFWDGKFMDIPNTIGAVSKIVGQTVGVRMFNVHAPSTIEGMAAAVQNKGSSQVLAVTVLTSTSDEDSEYVYGALSKKKVLQFARDAKLAGCDGVVCSPLELPMLDAKPEFIGFRKVTPGIRSTDDPPDDQKRTMSAREAITAGANELVIGRPITGAPDMVKAAQAITEQIVLGLRDRFFLSLYKQQKIKFGQFKLKLHEQNPTAPLSPIYLNIRDLPSWMYTLAGDILHDLYVQENIGEFDYVVGIPKAGEPIGIAFAKALGKTHLRIEKVEGEGGRHISSNILDSFEKGKKVIIVDDLITKADTKREAIKSMEANGLMVVATLVLCDREQGGLKELNEQGHVVRAAAKVSDVLDTYITAGKIKPEQKDKVMTYIREN